MAFKPVRRALGAAFFGMFVSTTPQACVATDSTHILGTDWGLTLKSDGSGFYNELARMVLPSALGEIDYEILPYKRAKRAFLESKTSCLYPNSLDYLVTTGAIDNPESYIGSRSVVAAQSRIFSPHGTRPPANVGDLQGLRVAYALGSDVANLLQGSGAYFVAVSDEVGKARMLLEGRTDLLVAVLPDAKFVFDSLGKELPPYDVDYSLDSTEIGLVCHKTEKNRAFIQAFDQHLKALIDSGKLRTFLISKGLDPKDHMPHQE
ncbi:hypothetical protein [Kordiimonas lacus]|uniref:Polar amino acid transport system substrate-binding protein n=1 Tax=Kordiimonas lacus TaxID=637679 RepID=A0A1G6YF17_9PROT|nr:hypothetical protein [Kordiimonas lacus]SDD88156.1 hypothetical protein SAMN04488071_1574 [Kordiimonas lacus]